MKKFLFTLCAVLVGFAASAADHYQLAFANAEGTPVTEITATPGTEVNLYVQLLALDQVCTGMQMEFVVRDNAMQPIDYNDAAGKVKIKGMQATPFDPVTWFTPMGMAMYHMPNQASVSASAQTVNGDNAVNYRIVGTNGTLNQFFVPAAVLAAQYSMTEEQVISYFGDCVEFGNIYAFTVVLSADWNEEYAYVDYGEAYSKFSGLPMGEQQLSEDLKLTIKNANFAPALKDLTGEIVISEPDENGQVTVTYTGNEDVTITVNGQPYTGPIQLEDGVETTIDVTVSADGYNDLTGSATRTWTAPVAAAEPTIEIVESADYLTMTVTVTAEEGCTLIVNGEAINSNTYTYTVNRTTDIYTADADVVVKAQAVKDLPSEEVTETKAWTVVSQPTAATPVITFEETKDGEVVTAVDVVIVNYTEYNINGEPYNRATVAHYDANYTADQVITVNAKNDPGYPYLPAYASDTYTLKKLEKADVAAPVITTTMDDDNVYVTIQWPESDGTQTYTGQYTYPRGEQDASYPVEAYVTEGATCKESAHATATIVVPKKETTPQPQDKTAMPTFSGRTPDGVHAYYVSIADVDADAVIYYRVYKDGVLITEGEDGWVVYDGEFGYTEDGNYRVEAYAVAPGKDPSDQIGYEFVISETTGLVDVMNGKTISNVRYFNMAGQEMQEANGLTIVVTTYTDGTTNSVKVLK